MVHILITVLVLYQACISVGQNLALDTCTDPRRDGTIFPTAEAFIGGLIDFSEQGESPYGCGAPMKSGMQAFEAMRWALHRINQDQGTMNGVTITDSYIPGIKLGLKIRNTCTRPDVATRAVQDFFPSLYNKELACQDSQNQLMLGTVGPYTEESTLTVAELSSQMELGQVSYSVTSTHLSDKSKYSHFMRTTPSNALQPEVMANLFVELQWKFIVIVHTNDSYGKEGFQNLRDAANKKGICVTAEIPVSGSNDKVINDILQTGVTGVVYFGGTQEARKLMETAATISGAGKLQWLFSESVSMGKEFTGDLNYIRGSLNIVPSIRHIAEFEDHWVNLNASEPPSDNPWFKDWYMESNHCRLNGVNYEPYKNYPGCILKSEVENRQEFSQESTVEPALVAVYTYAKALKNAQVDLCGANINGICENLFNLTSQDFFQNYLKKVNFTFTNDERIPTLASSQIAPLFQAKKVEFDKNGDPSTSDFDVWNYNDRSGSFKYERVGTFVHGKLDLSLNKIMFYNAPRESPLSDLVTSPCPDVGCSACLSSPSDSPFYAYVPGDIIIGGVFPVHESEAEGIGCGPIDAITGAQYVQSFFYAIERVKTLGFFNPSVTVGAVVFDNCDSRSRTETLITDFQNSAVPYFDHHGNTINPSSVTAYVGTDLLMEVLDYFGLPQIGYQTKITHEIDTKMTPFYIQTPPADKEQYQALLLLLKKYKWNYIQVLHSSSMIYNKNVDIFKDMAQEEKICITSIYSLDSDSSTALVEKLEKKTEAKVLVIFGSEDDITPFLTELASSQNGNSFQIVLAEVGNEARKILQAVGSFMQGTFGTQVKKQAMPTYTNALKRAYPTGTTTNPWFVEWYEASFNCYLDSENPHGFSKLCEKTDSIPIADAPNFDLDPYNMYVIDAVFAVAKGLDKTLKDVCGSSYEAVCSEFRNNPNIADSIVSNTLQTTFMNEAGLIFKFEDRMGKFGFDILNVQDGEFVKVGEYPNSEGSLTLDQDKITFKSGSPIESKCHGFCNGCQYLYDQQQFLYVPGDLLIGGVVNVHKSGSSLFSCGDVRVEDGYQYSEAISYALKEINNGRGPVQLSGLHLGGVVVDGCSSPIRSANLVSGLYSGSLVLAQQEEMVAMEKVIGWLSYTSGSSSEISHVTKALDILQISPSATSTSFLDEEIYPTLFRTVQADDRQFLAVSSLLKQLGYGYINVIYSPGVYGETAYQSFKKISAEHDVCILGSYQTGNAVETVTSLLQSPTNVVLILAGFSEIQKILEARRNNPDLKNLLFIGTETWGDSKTLLQEMTHTPGFYLTFKIQADQIVPFNDYLTQYPISDQSNPWFEDYYEAFYNCSLGNSFQYSSKCASMATKAVTNSSSFQQDQRVASTVNAIYAIAQALDMVLKKTCGAIYNGICDDFKNHPNIQEEIQALINGVSFTDPTGMNFAFMDRQHDRGYKVLQFQSGNYQEIGSFGDDLLDLTDINSLKNSLSSVTSECSDQCLQCQYQTQDKEEFSFITGNIFLAGIFDVHEGGATPYKCGDINIQGAQLLEAFNFAIDMVNKKKGIFEGILDGVNLGGVGLDACESKIKAGALVANIHSGVLPLDAAGIRLDTSLINTYVGAFLSMESMQIADILEVFGIPQISYGSTIKKLSDYSYFLRTVPADDKLANAIIALLKRSNIRYVQVVSSEGTYGKLASEEFLAKAADNDICIAQHSIYKTTRTLRESADEVVSDMLRKPDAQIVIVFLESYAVNPFLLAMERNAAARQRFHLIGSDTWANNENLITDVASVVKNITTFGVESADLTDFDMYLDEKTPNSYKRNPWFEEFYETMYECNISPGSNEYSKLCENVDRGIARASNYRQDPYVLYTVNAVYSVALGLHTALEDLCGENYFGLCTAFTNSGKRRQEILEGLKKARFVDATKQMFGFNQDGDSFRGYHIYAIQENLGSSDSFYYQNVGSYNDSHLLKIDSRYQIQLKADCSAAGSCQECRFTGRRTSQYMQVPSQENLNLVGFFDVHRQHRNDPLQCGDMDIGYGFQNLLAFFYSINKINHNDGYQYPLSLKLGGLAIDTCSNHLRTTQELFTYLSTNSLCGASSADLVQVPTVVAYIPMGTGNSKQAMEILSPKALTAISPSADDVSLNDDLYLLRTVPPNTNQAKILAEVAKEMGWTYLSLVNSDNDYGNSLADAFLEASAGSEDSKEGSRRKRSTTVCVGKQEKVPKNLDLAKAERIMGSLSQDINSRVLVAFVSLYEASLLMQATQNLNLVNRFIWISDMGGPNNRERATPGMKEVQRGSIAIEIRNSVAEGFIGYVKTLNLNNHGDIPDDWFEEFWQHTFKCRLENATNILSQYNKACASDDKITEDVFQQDPYVLHTMTAVHVVADGLKRIEECIGSSLGISGCLSQQSNREKLIFDSIRSSQIDILRGETRETYEFKFNDANYGDVEYVILNYQRNEDLKDYEFVKIGSSKGGLLFLDKDKYKDYNFVGLETPPPDSQCPSGKTCTCISHNKDDTNTVIGKDKPKSQEQVQLSNENFGRSWGIVVAVFSGIGIIISIIMLIFLIILYPIKGGTTVIGFLMLISVICLYVLNFAFIMYPDTDICIIRKFCLGMIYALIFSCMLVKVLNTWRLGSYQPETEIPSYTRLSHPCCLLLITLGIALIQAVIAMEWLIFEPTAVESVWYENSFYPRCAESDFHNEELILSVIYIMVLIVLVLIFSALTWDSKENHWESRWILVCTCVTIITWICWGTVSTLTEYKYRDPAIAIANLVIATCILGCIYLRKLYLLKRITNDMDDDKRSLPSGYPPTETMSKENGLYTTTHLNHSYDLTNDDMNSIRSSKGGSGVMYIYDGRGGKQSSSADVAF